MISIDRAEPSEFLAIAHLDRLVWRNYPQSEFIPDGEHVWRVWCEYANVLVARPPRKHRPPETKTHRLRPNRATSPGPS